MPRSADQVRIDSVAVAAETLYLVNLLLLPGLGFLLLLLLWWRYSKGTTVMAAAHLSQTLSGSIWAGILLVLANALIVLLGGYAIYRRSMRMAGIIIAISAVTFYAYLITERPNNQLVFVTPYVVTLIAVSVGAQRQRPPAEEGIPWFKGMQ